MLQFMLELKINKIKIYVKRRLGMGDYCLYYAAWEEVPEQLKLAIADILGESIKNVEMFYKRYFYWFNVVHEMGHILRRKYGTTSKDAWDEEQNVNDFAVAFWQQNKQDQHLEYLMKNMEIFLARIPNPVYSKCDEKEYFNKNYNELDPMGYGFFQFNFVLNSLKKKQEFYDVIKNNIYSNAVYMENNCSINYDEVNDTLPQKIIDDLRKYLISFGIELPQVTAIKQFTSNIQYVSCN